MVSVVVAVFVVLYCCCIRLFIACGVSFFLRCVSDNALIADSSRKIDFGMNVVSLFAISHYLGSHTPRSTINRAHFIKIIFLCCALLQPFQIEFSYFDAWETGRGYRRVKIHFVSETSGRSTDDTADTLF